MESDEAIIEFPTMMDDDIGNVAIADLESALEVNSPEANQNVPKVNPLLHSPLRSYNLNNLDFDISGNQAADKGKNAPATQKLNQFNKSSQKDKLKSDTMNPSQKIVEGQKEMPYFDSSVDYVALQQHGICTEFEDRSDNHLAQSVKNARITKWIESVDKEELDEIIQTDWEDCSNSSKEWPLLDSKSVNRNDLDFDLSGSVKKHKYNSDKSDTSDEEGKETSMAKKLTLSDSLNPFLPNVTLSKQKSTNNLIFDEDEIYKPNTMLDIGNDFHCSQMSPNHNNSRFKEWIDSIDIECISNSPVDENLAKGIIESNFLHSTNKQDIQQTQKKPQQSNKRNHLDFDSSTDATNENRPKYIKFDSDTQTADEVSASKQNMNEATINLSQPKIETQTQSLKLNANEPVFEYGDYDMGELPCSQLSQHSNNNSFKEWIDFGDIDDISNFQIDNVKGNNESPNNTQDIVLPPISTLDKSFVVFSPALKGLDKSMIFDAPIKNKLAESSMVNMSLIDCEYMMNMPKYSQLDFMQPSSSSLFNDAKTNDTNEKSLSNNSFLLNGIDSNSKRSEDNIKENSLKSEFILNDQNQNLTESITSLNQTKLFTQSGLQDYFGEKTNQFPLLEDEQKNKIQNIEINAIFKRGSQRKTSPDISSVPPSIKKLYDIILDKHSEYSFVYAISAQLCQEHVPMESYVYLKMSLLLSLASFEPNSNRPPVSLLIVCYDTYMANYLISTIGKLAKRFIGPFDKIKTPLQKSAFKCTWNDANPLMMSQGGVYYAGDWKRLKNAETETLLKCVENSTVTSDRAKDENALDTAIWSLWHPGDDFKREALNKFFLVFGLPIILKDDDNDEVNTDYVLNRYRVGIYEPSTDILNIPYEEMREFLEEITKIKVNMTTAATQLLQQYFVVTRHVRPDVLSKQSFVVMKLFAESFAKLSLRTEVIEMDAVASIFLCENFIHNVYGWGKNPPPKFMSFTHIDKVDSYMTEFYNWLQNYLQENYDECNAADFTKFSEYKD